MPFKIDHVTFAAARLDTLVTDFSDAGLAADYGGPHSNGISHMSLLAFDDGTYIELISTLEPGVHAPRWNAFIAANGGACAWAVESTDIQAEAARLKGRNTSVVGPTYVTRERPDGTLVEWDLAFVGDDGPGAMQPFLIQDRTPRNFRVQPSPSVSGSELTGIAKVVIAVRDLKSAAELFMRDYGLGEPRQVDCKALGASVFAFPDEPLALAAPRVAGDWLDERLDQFGTCPCAYILGSEDMRLSRTRYSLAGESRWLGSELGWFDTEGLQALRLGVMAV